MAAKNVLERLNGYRAQLEQLAADRELSSEGKAKRAEPIRAASKAYRTGAYKDLYTDWQAALTQVKKLDAARKDAEAKAAARWDYQALGYEAMAAKAALSSANTIEDARRLYQAAANSGNQAKARAWAETAAPVVRARFAGSMGMEANGLALQMEADAVKFTRTAELDAVEAQQEAHAADVAELARITESAAKHFDNNFWDLGSFGKLLHSLDAGLPEGLTGAEDPAARAAYLVRGE